jgi:hypothetical protein
LGPLLGDFSQTSWAIFLLGNFSQTFLAIISQTPLVTLSAGFAR